MSANLKISELPVAPAISADDVSVLVTGNADYQFTFAGLLQFVMANLPAGVLGSRITFAQGGAPPDSAGKEGDVIIDPYDQIFYQKNNGTWQNRYHVRTDAVAPGNAVLYGSGLPAQNTGHAGDTYINTLNGSFYQKTDSRWNLAFTMLNGPAGGPGPKGDTGAAGANGKSVLSGAGNPSNQTTGTNGDFYLNTNTYNLFGPKTNGSWGTGIDLLAGTPPDLSGYLQKKGGTMTGLLNVTTAGASGNAPGQSSAANFIAQVSAGDYGQGRYPGIAFLVPGIDAICLYAVMGTHQDDPNAGLWVTNFQGLNYKLPTSYEVGNLISAAVAASTHYKGKYTALSGAPATGADGDYILVDAGAGSDAKEYIWDSSDSKWVASGSSGASSFGQLAGNPADNTALAATLNNLVPKAAGQGLSTNDYTTPEKNKLGAISRSFTISYTSPVNEYLDYFENAETITAITGTGVGTFKYSVDGGNNYTAAALPLTAPVNIAADTWVRWRITFAVANSMAALYFKLQ